jgi:hypothetical protein
VVGSILEHLGFAKVLENFLEKRKNANFFSLAIL